MNPILLPADLEPFRVKFENSIRPFVSIVGNLQENSLFWDSKLGGYPYLPQNNTIPKDSQDNWMVLLAQINWQQMPTLENYPSQGITQFFISKTEDYLYGINFDKPTLQKNWRIVHYPEIEKRVENLNTDFSFLPNDKELYERTPFEFPYKIPQNARNFAISMQFELKQSPVLSRDYEFAWHINEGEDFFWYNFYPNNSAKGYRLMKEYDQLYPPYGHKIGGYAGFSQEDWRKYNKNANLAKIPKKNPWILLLQIQSDAFFQWGDCGVGNFFIRKEDLLQLNFSKVRYHWDCC